jgi:calcium-dependent protein kinase
MVDASRTALLANLRSISREIRLRLGSGVSWIRAGKSRSDDPDEHVSSLTTTKVLGLGVLNIPTRFNGCTETKKMNVTHQPERKALIDGPFKPDVCPRDHLLKQVTTQIEGFLCNKCGKTTGPLPKGTVMLACRSCDYDICISCNEALRGGVFKDRTAGIVAPKLAQAGLPESESVQTGPGLEKLRELTELLSDPDAVTAKAEEWLRVHDVRNVGSLGSVELMALCTKLNSEFGIPPIDEATVAQCIRKFDTNDDNRLDLSEFKAFYARLLVKIRDHYGYVKVRRDFFLSKSPGKPTDWYKVKKMVGQGSFGIVQLVEDKRVNNRTLVMKTISKSKMNLSLDILEQEIKNLRSLDHPNIIKILEYFDDAQNIYIVMENAESELLKVVEDNFKNGRYVNERWAMEVFRQVLEAIVYCHGRGVMHKDLKAENVMLIDSLNNNGVPHAVVIDFGLAEMFDDPSRRSRVVSGSPMSMAPEVWGSAINKNVSIGYKCDVYSLGCVIFHVLSGDFPIMAKTNEPSDWLRKIKIGPNWSLLSHCSPEAVDLVKKMMTIDERLRPTAKECLQHPWFATSGRPGNDTKTQPALLSSEQLKALIKYNTRTAFEKAVFMKIATRSKVSELARVNKIFYALDRDSKGFIDKAQCGQALVQLGLPRDMADQTARSLDVDGNNRIEYTELVAGLISFSEDHIENMLWTVFTGLDRDGNGYLDLTEIKRLLNQGALHNIGLEAQEAEILETFKSIDKDKSGTISFAEFKEFFLTRR